VSPGTGAQFAILPPQNASGNWVKVVQRVPVRIAFDPGEDVRALRSGMSVTVDIDTATAAPSRRCSACGRTPRAIDHERRDERTQRDLHPRDADGSAPCRRP